MTSTAFTWADFYLICFAVGFSFSFFSFVFGSSRLGKLHLPHFHSHAGHLPVAHGPVAHGPVGAAHGPAAGHGGTHSHAPASVSPFNPPSVAAFHLGTEAQLGVYASTKGPMTMAIYDYPTPAIAMERYNNFQMVPGVVAKRAGPLLAVIVQPPDADAAERLLAHVGYNANLMWNEQVGGPTVKDSAKMILTIMGLAGIILGLCLVAGIGFGAFRVVLRKLGWKGPDSDEMITLNLQK